MSNFCSTNTINEITEMILEHSTNGESLILHFKKGNLINKSIEKLECSLTEYGQFDKIKIRNALLTNIWPENCSLVTDIIDGKLFLKLYISKIIPI